jgi:hypothetical protein
LFSFNLRSTEINKIEIKESSVKMSIKIVLIVLSLGLVLISQAQSTPDQSENECFVDGMLYDNCNTTDVDKDGDVEQDDKDWMHTCGYYLAQVDNGIILNDQIPLEGCTKQERVIPRPEKPKEKTRRVTA